MYAWITFIFVTFIFIFAVYYIHGTPNNLSFISYAPPILHCSIGLEISSNAAAGITSQFSRWKAQRYELPLQWHNMSIMKPQITSKYYTHQTTNLFGVILVSLRLSVRPSFRPSVRLSRLPCPLCNIYSSEWILSILATNDHYYERVCRTQWHLTLTYIFKVIRPWLIKSCPLCSVYSSRWILFIFNINNHYH